MGSVGDYWRESRDEQRAKQRRKEATVDSAIRALRDAGFDGRWHGDDGAFRVENAFEWWPADGYWRSLDGKHKGHQVRPLVKALVAAGVTPSLREQQS